MAASSHHRVSGAQDGVSERPATGYGEPEAGLLTFRSRGGQAEASGPVTAGSAVTKPLKTSCFLPATSTQSTWIVSLPSNSPFRAPR